MTTVFYAGRLHGSKLVQVGPLSLDLNNRNAVILFDALGIVSAPHGDMPLDKFLSIARAWLQAHIGKPSMQVASREHEGDGALNVIDLPLRAGYVNERVHQLVTMLARAKEQGATHVYWG